jgi:hypothetical protein
MVLVYCLEIYNLIVVIQFQVTHSLKEEYFYYYFGITNLPTLLAWHPTSTQNACIATRDESERET